MTNIISCTNLTKTYTQGHTEVPAVRNVNISIEKGHIVAIIGHSGAGKSTLLHMLGSLEKPSLGTVSFIGKDLYSLSDKNRSALRNQKAGFIFQFFNLMPDFTVLENVMMPALMKKVPVPTKTVKDSALMLLNRLDMGHRLAHRPSELSGGEQQRVAIARALVNDPEIIFCDEPTGNLDSAMSEQIYGIIYEIVRERSMTAVIVTHHLIKHEYFDVIHEMKDGVLLKSHSTKKMR